MFIKNKLYAISQCNVQRNVVRLRKWNKTKIHEDGTSQKLARILLLIACKHYIYIEDPNLVLQRCENLKRSKRYI